MRPRPHIGLVLQSGGFSLHHRVGRLLKVGFLPQCWIVALVAVFAILVGSAIDGSLLLPGRNIGLLQHPGIWAFLGLQIALPLSIRHSLKRLLRAHSKIRVVATLNDSWSHSAVAPVLQFLRLQDVESKLVATVVYCVGHQATLAGVPFCFDQKEVRHDAGVFRLLDPQGRH